MTKKQENNGPFVVIDYSFHLQQQEKLQSDPLSEDDEESIGLSSSVRSGMRSSLHSSFTFNDLEQFEKDSSSVCSLLSSEDEQELPHWRLNPRVSGSDFKLIVQSIPDGTYSEYRIHQGALTEGLKKSDYFVSFFNLSKERIKLEKKVKECTVKINKDASKLIPIMLDYLYSSNDDLHITSESAVAMRHLSEFFGIRALASRVLCFMQVDLKFSNMYSYITKANEFDDLETLTFCAQRCAENLEELLELPGLLARFDPSFVLDMFSKTPPKELEQRSQQLSQVVSIYCYKKRDVLDEAVFEELTCVEHIPIIATDAAIKLMLAESVLSDAASDENKRITPLQARCIRSVAGCLVGPCDHADERVRKWTRKSFQRLPKKVLAELLSLTFQLPCKLST